MGERWGWGLGWVGGCVWGRGGYVPLGGVRRSQLLSEVSVGRACREGEGLGEQRVRT